LAAFAIASGVPGLALCDSYETELGSFQDIDLDDTVDICIDIGEIVRTAAATYIHVRDNKIRRAKRVIKELAQKGLYMLPNEQLKLIDIM